MTTRDGMVFDQAPLEKVTYHLRSRKIELLSIPPERMRLDRGDDGSLFLEVVNGVARQFPVRTAFMRKLLRWFRFPTSHLRYLSDESVVSILNDHLLNIRGNEVRVKIEDGEALTIVSDRYAELNDLEVIRHCGQFGIAGITRDDFRMRLYTDVTYEAEPVVGDLAGFSMNVTNSETGFSSLAVYLFMLRYVCANGAVVPAGRSFEKRYHYRYSTDDMLDFLGNEVKKVKRTQMKMVERLKKGVDSPAEKKRDVAMRELNHLLGGRNGTRMIEELADDATLYDLFNHITAAAREEEVNTRMRMEIIAGSLIMN